MNHGPALNTTLQHDPYHVRAGRIGVKKLGHPQRAYSLVLYTVEPGSAPGILKYAIASAAVYTLRREAESELRKWIGP